MLALEYNTLVVLGGTMLLGVAAGTIGTLALLRGRALLGDALAHATLPGIWLAFLLFGRQFTGLLAGALVTGVLGVVTVIVLNRFTRLKEDVNIGIVLSVFFGAGIALSGYIQNHSTDAAQAGIGSFILGRTAGMVRSDVLIIGTTALVVVITVIALFKEMKLLCFDPDFATVEGWPVVRLDLLLFLLLGVTTVIGLPAVGVVLIVALLILPAAAARFWVTELRTMLILAALFGMLTGASGTLLSAYTTDLPAGPLIVLSGTAIFLVSMLAAPRRGLVASALQRRRLRNRRLLQGLLRALYERGEASLPARPAVPFADLITKRAISERAAARLLRAMEGEGWVEGAVDGWRLTEAGVLRAAEIVRIHRLWEHYLLSSADIDRDLVDPDSEIIEEVLPAEEIARLERELVRAGRFPAPARRGRARAGSAPGVHA